MERFLQVMSAWVVLDAGSNAIILNTLATMTLRAPVSEVFLAILSKLTTHPGQKSPAQQVSDFLPSAVIGLLELEEVE
jgi:hypothetical protein